MSLANNMEVKFPSKILVFVTVITHNCDSFFCWSQIFHILLSIYEGFILPSQIRFFERAFWVRHKFLVANRHFFCSGTSFYKLVNVQFFPWAPLKQLPSLLLGNLLFSSVFAVLTPARILQIVFILL